MEPNRTTAPDVTDPAALAQSEAAAASFLDSVMDLLDGPVSRSSMRDDAKMLAEAQLARQLRDAIRARLRDAA